KEILTNYQWYTEDYPPYNYLNKAGQLVGIYPDILKLIYKELKLEKNLNEVMIVPWARLFRTLETTPTYAAFTMIKTPERDKKFQLVDLPILTKISIMVLAKNKDILSHKNIKELTYAVVRQDIGEHLLNNQLNIQNKISTTSASSMLNMLLYNRVEAIAYAELVANFQLSNFDLENEKLVSIYTLSDKFKTAFVFHKDTPICVSTLFSKIIALLNEQGEINRIVQKYHRE
ncbi:MAG: transporter substrate-binding domain-containing protein, partial [Colwellia sp.]|nr:transporter substrate-binding domain-containing protein [Colwellia sp.]